MSAAFPRARAMARNRPGPSSPRDGSSTISATATRSSTIDMPIMMRPCREWSSPRSRRRRAGTMVLETGMTIPMTSPGHAAPPPPPPPAPEDRQGPAQEGHPLHTQEIAHRELDADREHEEHDADLGEE